MGFLFQNFVHNILQEKYQRTNIQIHYWRTINKAEVDFVIDKGIEIIPIEVKCAENKAKNIGRSLYSFIEKYKPKEAWIINLSTDSIMKVNNTLVKFISIFNFICESLSS